MLNPLSIVNSTATKIQLKTWICFHTLNKLQALQTCSLNHCHLLWHGWKLNPAQGLRWAITFLSHGNATLRVAFGRTCKTIPTTHLWCVNCTNISSVGSRRRAWTCTMTTCWNKKILLCVSQASNTGMLSTIWCTAYQMISVLGSGNYTLWRIWDGMTITNARSDTRVEISPKEREGWCSRQPMPSNSFTLLSVDLTAIHHWCASILKSRLRTGGGRHRWEMILQDNTVIIDSKSTLIVGDALVP